MLSLQADGMCELVERDKLMAFDRILNGSLMEK